LNDGFLDPLLEHTLKDWMVFDDSHQMVTVFPSAPVYWEAAWV
jgi:hypothetical protein